MSPFLIAVTFDVDMAGGAWGEAADECGYFFRAVLPEAQRAGVEAGTIFVRIDDEMMHVYGRADYLLSKYEIEFRQLRESGWEIGWHPHPYTRVQGVAQQNTNEAEIVAELFRHGPQARAAGMTSVRMGWGYATPAIMNSLEQLGFLVDSSAIPRPRYAWETSIKDWAGTPRHAYYPSVLDCRVPGTPRRNILELPVSVLPVCAPYDTQTVLRHVNPAYRQAIFETALTAATFETMITVTHPHELLPADQADELLSRDPAVLRRNLQFLADHFSSMHDVQWRTISNLAAGCG